MNEYFIHEHPLIVFLFMHFLHLEWNVTYVKHSFCPVYNSMCIGIAKVSVTLIEEFINFANNNKY